MKPRYILRWTAGILALVMVVTVAVFYYQFNERMRGEYETIRVTQMVEDYVKSHEGNWPKSWEDLDGTETAKRMNWADSSYWRRYTKVDFTVQSEQLIADPKLIYRSVLPMNGEYHVYPDAKMDLDKVMEAIREAKKAAKSAAQRTA
jgi:hypothetical protein